MKRFGHHGVALLLVTASPVLQAVCPEVSAASLCLDINRYSAPLSLDDLIRSRLEAVQPSGHNNLIYVRDQLSLAFSTSTGEWALLARQSATLHARDGAMRVIGDVETSGKPQAAYREDVQLEMQGFAGKGLAWRSPRIELLPALTLRAGIQALQVNRYVYRDLDGVVSFNPVGDVYSLMAESNHRSDKLSFHYQKPFDKHGQAWLTDFSIGWHMNAGSTLSFELQDWGRLWWRSLPQDQKRVSSDTSAVDENGYVVYQPLIQGQYRQKTIAQAIWPTAVLSLQTRAWQPGLVELEVRKIDHTDTWLPAVSMSYPWMGISWRGTWLVREHAVALGLQWRGLSLRMGGDRLDSDAKALQASIALAFPLF